MRWDELGLDGEREGREEGEGFWCRGGDRSGLGRLAGRSEEGGEVAGSVPREYLISGREGLCCAVATGLALISLL